MPFIQMIEVMTAQPDRIEAITAEWAAKTKGTRKTVGAVLTADQGRPGISIQIVEFRNYQEAMENSDLPETARFAEQLADLADTPPTFRNLEVRHTYDLD